MKFLDVTLEERKVPVIEIEPPEERYDWRFENSINFGRTHLEVKKEDAKYNKWRTNGSLSNFLDTIMHANLMNINYHISDQMHYDYLFYAIKKNKRFKKKDENLKKLKIEAEKLALVQEYYKYNTANARAALRILTEEQLTIIRKKLEKGGVK